MLTGNHKTLMFLGSKRFEGDKAVRGAFLLTDLDTKPLEFRCTNPIRPTALQTVLYGDMLQRHMMVELIGVPLVTSIKTPPSAVLVEDAELLWLRSKVAVPVLRLTKESQIAVAESDGGNSALLSSHSGQFEPVVVVAHKDFRSDVSDAMPLLTQVFNRFDLAEPFNRVAVALDQVHQQKIGENK